MRVGWLTTAIFGDLSGYFFANFKDKASNVKLGFRTRSFTFRGFDFEA